MQIPKPLQDELNKKANIEDLIDEMHKAKTNQELLFVAHKLVARDEAIKNITFDLIKIINDENNRTVDSQKVGE